MKYISEYQYYRCWEETYLGFIKISLHHSKTNGKVVVNKIDVTSAFKMVFNFKKNMKRIYNKLNNTK